MSEHNVELHRRAIEAFEAGDLDALLARADPSIEYHPVLAAIGGVSVYRGHDGIRSWFADFDEWGSDVHVEPRAYFALGAGRIVGFEGFSTPEGALDAVNRRA
jgi:ketosteroid isomerase-like protein